MKKFLFLFFNCLLIFGVYSQDDEHSIILKLKKSNDVNTNNAELSSEFNLINKNISPSIKELNINSDNRLIKLTFPKNISIDSVLSVYKKSGKYEFVEQDFIGYGLDSRFLQTIIFLAFSIL